SGRGVGMDVVRQAVEALRGVLDIASTPGQGTTFTIKLPLTLAIIDGLLVQLAGDHYVLPLAAVEECIELRRDDAVSHGRNIVIIRGEIVPFIRLRDFFAIATAAPEIEQIVIVNVEGARVGFALDAVIGQHQTVIKSLGKVYQEVQGISGATILGNGSVALILDLPQLARAQQVLEAAAVA
ncbi:MAG TPA: chemotaxis protein CheA, partial [Desulfuromonas sp.]|nr:chemotaxis protein CheA [Desulfuromonas sp.]